MARLIVRLAIVLLGGLLLGGAAYLALLLLRNPTPGPAEGWQLAAPLIKARGETATAVADDKLWVIGGLTGVAFESSREVSVYSLADDSWTAAPALPAPRDHAGAAAGEDGTIYVSGGGSPAGEPTSTFWSIRDGDAGWHVLPPMPEARIAHRMVAVGSRLYVVGGRGQTGRVLIFDPSTQTWSTGAELPDSRDHLAAVAVDHEVWAIGGRINGLAVPRVDIYDPASDTWRAGPPLPAPTSAAAEGVLDGAILLLGGEDPQRSDRVLNRSFQLDIGPSASWREIGHSPLPVHGAQGAVVDGALVIAGGASRPGSMSRLAWSSFTQVYRPSKPS